MAGVLASSLTAGPMSPPAAAQFSTPRSSPSPSAARMLGRLWLPPAGGGTARRWSNDVFGIFEIKGSLVLGKVLGFTVASIGSNQETSCRSSGIDLADIEVEEAVFSGRFEDLTADEQPGFIITTGDFKHSFVVSSRSEQKRWVTCLRDLSCLEEVECRQVTPRTARSSAGLGDEEEASRLKQQLVKERGRSDRLQLKIEDLLSEQRGLRKALDAALTMMSDCHRGIATPRALSPAKKEGPSNLQSNHPTEQDRGYALVAGLEMAQQLETTSQSLHATETTISALVWELSSLVQQRDAAFSSLSTLRGSEDAYDLASASEVGAVKHEHEHRSGTPMQKRLSSSSIARPLRPTPITVPEHEEGEEKTITPSPRDTTGRLPRKSQLQAGSVGSRDSPRGAGRKPLGHMSFV